MKSTLATETGANNPGVRLFKYDINTGQVKICQQTAHKTLVFIQILDFDQYYLNLTHIISGGEPTWEKAYSMLEYFNLNLDYLSSKDVATNHILMVF